MTPTPTQQAISLIFNKKVLTKVAVIVAVYYYPLLAIVKYFI